MRRDEANAALAALDRALEDRPDKVYEDMAEAVRRLVALRDTLIAERHHGHGGELRKVNEILSHVVGAEYPLEGVRRERVEKAREELAGIFSE